MTKFLDLVESFRAADASKEKLFGGTVGFKRVDETQLAEAAQFLDSVVKGRVPSHRLQEAMSTSDFPYLFGAVIDRALYGAYTAMLPNYAGFVKQETVRDFRSVERYVVDGAQGQLDLVAEGAGYPADSVSEAKYTYSVAKYGKRLPFSWETMINDDLDALKDMPQRLALAARRTEAKFVTGLFCTTTGPHGSLYTSGNRNLVTTAYGASANNPPLSIKGLQDAMIVMANQVDADGEPIMVDAVTLVVPPALEITARNIINATMLDLNMAGGFVAGLANSDGYQQRLMVENWMRGRVSLVVDPYIPLVATSSNGATSWFLFGNPSTGRPALVLGKLRGHEAPELFMKSPNATRVGGGTADPMAGDFDTDSLEYKVRHVFGGARIDGKTTVASNGSGS